MPFFQNAPGRTIANEIHVNHQDAAQFLWSASRVHVHCATIDVYRYATELTRAMHYQLFNHLSQVSSLLFCVRANDLPLENEVPAVSWKLYRNCTAKAQRIFHK